MGGWCGGVFERVWFVCVWGGCGCYLPLPHVFAVAVLSNVCTHATAPHMLVSLTLRLPCVLVCWCAGAVTGFSLSTSRRDRFYFKPTRACISHHTARLVKCSTWQTAHCRCPTRNPMWMRGTWSRVSFCSSCRAPRMKMGRSSCQSRPPMAPWYSPKTEARYAACELLRPCAFDPSWAFWSAMGAIVPWAASCVGGFTCPCI